MISKLISLLLFLFATYSFANISGGAIHKTTLNNCQVAAEGFALNLMKGKLDNQGYRSLKEKVGILAKGQKLKAGQPVFVAGSLTWSHYDVYENSWTVTLNRVSLGIPNNAPSIFTVDVHCKVARSRQSLRGSPYRWDPNCKVTGIAPE